MRWLARQGREAHYTKEPTTGPFGAALQMHISKRLMAAPRERPKVPLNEATVALAFAADRMDHIHNEVGPFLEDGITVIADRYYLSSLAYQSLTADYAWIKALNRAALRPDLTIFLSVPPAVCKRRMEKQRQHVELYEEIEKLREVDEQYQFAIKDLATDGEYIVSIDGDRPINEVHTDAVRLVRKLLGKSSSGLGSNGQISLSELLDSDDALTLSKG